MSDRPPREALGDLAAHLLGHHTDAERHAFEARLAHDPELQAEVEELAPVVRALGRVDPDQLPATPPALPADLVDRTVQRVGWVAAAAASQRRSARRRRILAGVAAGVVAAAIVALIVGSTVLDDGDGGGTRTEFALAPDGVDAAYEVVGTPEGTEVTLWIDGLDPDAVYWLWLTADDGTRHAAGIWDGDPGGEPVVFETDVPMDDADRVWVTDDREGNSIVLDELPPDS
jgi:hypothetical protein